MLDQYFTTLSINNMQDNSKLENKYLNKPLIKKAVLEKY